MIISLYWTNCNRVELIGFDGLFFEGAELVAGSRASLAVFEQSLLTVQKETTNLIKALTFRDLIKALTFRVIKVLLTSSLANLEDSGGIIYA